MALKTKYDNTDSHTNDGNITHRSWRRLFYLQEPFTTILSMLGKAYF